MVRKGESTTNQEMGKNTSMSCDRDKYKGGCGGGARKPSRKSYEAYKEETLGMGGLYFNAIQSK